MKTKILWMGVITSLLINLIFILALYVSEVKGHAYALFLERKGLISLSEDKHPDHLAFRSWTNTIKKLDIEFDAAFFGNSITHNSNFQIYYPTKKIINLGYPGDNLMGIKRRIPMLEAANPKKIFIMIGTNDLFYESIDNYSHKYKDLICSIQSSIPNAKIYLQSILPMNQDIKKDAPSNEKITQANNAIKLLSKEFNLPFIDIYSLYEENEKLPTSISKDGIHISSESYEKWALFIEPYINDLTISH